MAIEVEDIPSLLRIVERFAKAVEKLKDVVLEGKIEDDFVGENIYDMDYLGFKDEKA